MGHSESAASLCGVAKAIIAFEKEIIPQNLHYEKPNSLCPALAKGTLKVFFRFFVFIQNFFLNHFK